MNRSRTARLSTAAEDRLTLLLVRVIAVSVVALLGLGLAGQSRGPATGTTGQSPAEATVAQLPAP